MAEMQLPAPSPELSPWLRSSSASRHGMSQTWGVSHGGPPAPPPPCKSEAQSKESDQNTEGGAGRAPQRPAEGPCCLQPKVTL